MNTLRVEMKEDYAIVYLDRGKVNAINHTMVREIRETFQDLKNESDIRGVIITGKPHFFSAGLDLIELYEYDLNQIRSFWTDFLGMMVDLAKFPKPTIAAISGHSPAGGAIIAITCDHRLMAEGEKYTIGLNEVSVGVLISEPIFHLYSFWLGERTAYQALLQGQLFSGTRAKQVGLVDHIYPLESLLEEAEGKMKSLLQANDFILRSTKVIMRKELLKKVSIDLSNDADARAKLWMSPESRKNIGKIVEQLTSRKK